MSVSIEAGLEGNGADHAALIRLARDAAGMAGDTHISREALRDVMVMLSEPRAEGDWKSASERIRFALVDAGINKISSLGLLPSRSPYSVPEIADIILSSLRHAPGSPDPFTIKAARATGMAFFSWALSGTNHLSALGQYVIGLASTAAAQAIAAEEANGKGCAHRLRKIARINEASKVAREEAAIDLLGNVAGYLRRD